MDYIIQNGIAVQYPKSLNQMTRELAVEVNRVQSHPYFTLFVLKGSYQLLFEGNRTATYDLDDLVP